MKKPFSYLNTQDVIGVSNNFERYCRYGTISNYISSPFSSLESIGKKRNRSIQRSPTSSSAAPLPIQWPFTYMYITLILTLVVEAGKFANPVNKNAQIPSRGAVNFPDVQSMAPPTFSLFVSKETGVPVVLKSALLWT